VVDVVVGCVVVVVGLTVVVVLGWSSLLERGVGQVTVAKAYRLLRAVMNTEGPPKWNSRRTVTLPAPIVDELRSHVAEFAEPDRNGRVFVEPKGGTLRRPNFQDAWVAATKAADVPTLRFHDLRHVGNTLASNTGASLRELMARMGHASPQAALIYQHATAERDRAIADALGEMIVASLADDDDDQGDEDE
jgi:integrase